MAYLERRPIHNSMEIPIQEAPDYANMDSMTDQQTEIKQQPETKAEPDNIGIIEKVKTAEMVAVSSERTKRVKEVFGFGPQYAKLLHTKAAGAERDYQRAKEAALKIGKDVNDVPRPLTQILNDRIGNVLFAHRQLKDNNVSKITASVDLDQAQTDFIQTIQKYGQKRIRGEVSPYKLLELEDKLEPTGLSVLTENGMQKLEVEEVPDLKVPIKK